MTQQCLAHWMGVVPYEQAWQIQTELSAAIAKSSHPPVLLLLEHPPSYTFGRRGQANNLLWNQAELAQRGVTVHWVDRGGDVTYHGPGQLVGYPLLRLATPNPRHPGTGDANPLNADRVPRVDYLGYLRKLEKTIILALARLGVASEQIPGLTGVWVQPDAQPNLHQCLAKIAAIGVKVDANGITRHGFALNVDPDMSYWEGIVACGLKDYPATCLAELLHPTPSMKRVVEIVVASFGEIFEYDMITSWQANPIQEN